MIMGFHFDLVKHAGWKCLVKYTCKCCKSIRHVQWFMELYSHTHTHAHRSTYNRPKEWIYNNKYLVNFRFYKSILHAFASYQCFEEFNWKPHCLPISFSHSQIRFLNRIHTPTSVHIEIWPPFRCIFIHLHKFKSNWNALNWEQQWRAIF